MGRYIAIPTFALCAVLSQAFTLATFADPSRSSATPLFTVTNTTVDAGYSGLGLTLEIPQLSAQYTDVTFTASTMTRVGTVLGPGNFSFFDSSSTQIFLVEFDSGLIVEPATTAGSFLLASNVRFSGSAVDSLGPFDQEQFAFAFANPSGTATTRTYTASFTSSAVPEPATLLALGLGGVALLRRRRRS